MTAGETYSTGKVKAPQHHCANIADGSQGVTHQVPPGDVVSCDDDTLVDDNHGMTVHDVSGRLQWSFKFFENLHMDLSPTHMEHLRAGMERKTRAIFEENYQVREGRRLSYTSFTGPPRLRRRRSPAIRPQDDPTWSPIIDVEYVSVPTRDDNTSPAIPSPTKATAKRRIPRPASGNTLSSTTSNNQRSAKGLMVIHRLAYAPEEEIVMGRFLLPLRRGLYEVIVIAGDGGWTQGGVSSHSLVVEGASVITRNNDAIGLRTLAMDGPEDDELFPNHCLTRVRRAMKWLTTEASLTVADVALPPVGSGSEVELSHLHCRIVPPPRFLYCPNPYSQPESNKYRFCRATLGGTDGVEMMVVSCWYGKDIGKGIKALGKVAMHGARVIHESQQMVHIRVDAQEVNLGATLAAASPQQTGGIIPLGRVRSNGSSGSTRGRWLLSAGVGGGGVTGGGSAIITVVDCADAQGRRKQNTIGWIREPTTGIVYLVYFADTLYMDENYVHQEIAGTLASIRAPRVLSHTGRRSLAWHATTPAPVTSR